MAQHQALKIFWIIIICILLLSTCVQPDHSPSPFDVLTGGEAQEQALPEGKVDGPDFIIIPDSELVFSPTTAGFSIKEAIASQDGFLSGYEEVIDGERYSGAEIVERVCREYSIHPRLMLSLLEIASGWVRSSDAEEIADYPFYKTDSTDAVLFVQLSWTADMLNRGYYSRRVDGLPSLSTKDGVEITIPQNVNDATAAVQYFLGKLKRYHDWLVAAGPLGLYAQYLALFGDPDTHMMEDLIPVDLVQPEMALPFGEGESWFFTSGPHSAWGTGAAWAALDFAPDEEGYGCYESDSQVTAVADGEVVRVGDGIVVQDLDGDYEEGTGWTILYMHIADDGKAKLGDSLKEGDPVGHPSCAGGPATGSHLHIARRFNGEWIPADRDIPFNLSGWVSRGDGLEYDGTLVKEQIEIKASGYPTDEHKIYH